MYPLKQSSALTVPFFAHDVNGDGVTGLLDAGFTKRISKNGAGFAGMTVTISEMENGWYSLPLSAAHTDTLGILTVSISHASIKRVNLQFRVHARINDDYAYPAVSGRSLDVDASGRTVLQAINHAGATIPAVTNVTGSVGSVTAAVTVGTLNANVITAGSIAAAALNGKGDWNIGKTGYTLLQAFPGNFADLAITATTGRVTVGTNLDKTGYALTQGFPANFASMAITAGGAVTVGTNNDKTGYSLSQAFPSNFANLSITAGGLVDITQGAADKTWLSTTRQLTSVQAFDNTGTWTGNITGSVGSIATAVTVGTLNAGVITAASIAAGALNGKGDWNIGKTDYALSAAYEASLVDLVWDEVLTAPTHNVPNSAGRRLRLLESGVFSFQGSLNGPQSVSVVRLDNSASSTNDFYKPGLIVIESSFGTQFARIDSYNGSNRDVTLATPLATQPSSGDTVTILPWASVRVTDIETGALDANGISAAAANKLADHAWRRTYANIRASSDGDAIVFRSPLGAVAKLVNKWAIAGSTLSLHHEDDTTVIGTQAVIGTAGADPITTLDTN